MTDASRGPSGGTPGDQDPVTADELRFLIKKEFQPNTDEAQEKIDEGVKTLAQQALAQTRLISNDVRKSIEALIAQIDKKLTEQINYILHHADFQKLEATWRGLEALVYGAGSDTKIKIRIMDMSKVALERALRPQTVSQGDQNPIFRHLYDEGYGRLGSEPFTCLIGDYYFDQNPPDVSCLSRLADVLRASQCVFIAGASAGVLQLRSWKELSQLRTTSRMFRTPEYAAWRSARRKETSRYIGLTVPRTLARAPYSSRFNPVTEFDFEEDVGSPDPERYCWMNAAFHLCANIARSHVLFGWCSRIRGIDAGGQVEGLPSHSFTTDDGGVGVQPGTETSITELHAKELADSGFIPLVQQRDPATAVFETVRSLNEPIEWDDDEVTVSAQLSSRLPYVLACCRFAHHLHFVVREKVQSVGDRSEVERWLQQWLDRYIAERGASHDGSGRPLSTGRVTLSDDEEDPGRSLIEFALRPKRQPEGLSVTLHLTAAVPRPG